MAADFLASHGINLQAEMSRVQFGASHPPPSSASSLPLPPPQPLTLLRSVLLPDLSPTEHHDIHISPTTGTITSITPSAPPSTSPPPLPLSFTAAPLSSALPYPQDTSVRSLTDCICLPSLCHPHIHLDKPHLLSHPRYSHLQPQSGAFAEALSLTAKAKELFEEEDLLQRANWLVKESMEAGVTHMRAFVEVDTSVGMRGVRAGEMVRDLWRGRCEVQLVAFAQEAVFSGLEGEDDGEDEDEGRGKDASIKPMSPEIKSKETNKSLLETAAALPSIPVLGSTPYVESSPALSRKNITWIISLAITHRKHLDLHLDYTLSPTASPQIFHVLSTLRDLNWTSRNPGKTVCLGHCTRLTLFTAEEWKRLREAVGDLPVYCVGLPTSDLFMMGRPEMGEEEEEEEEEEEGDGAKSERDRPRGTLQVPWMIQRGFKACLGVNNVGNAFTPQGSADPLSVACLGVGIYQAGTGKDAEVLYECVSTRAREAIGLGGVGGNVEAGPGEGGRGGDVEDGEVKKGFQQREGLGLKEGDIADLVVYGEPLEKRTTLYRARRSVQEIVYDAGRERVVIRAGKIVRVE
ncbi:hypothetical protein MMC30_003929 [Trapelia coarctata]|nr:hypothetical protein [Trapelia coarctata]